MEARVFDLNYDYPVVANWWSNWKFPIMPPEMLPPTGIIVEDEGGAICCGWLYKFDAKISMIEWVVSNPESTKKQRAEALDTLIGALVKEAKVSDYKVIISCTKIDALVKRFEKAGFVIGDTNVTHVVRRF